MAPSSPHFHSSSPRFSPYWKTHKCRYFDDKENPIKPYCSKGHHCAYAHPSDRAWKSAKRIASVYKPEAFKLDSGWKYTRSSPSISEHKKREYSRHEKEKPATRFHPSDRERSPVRTSHERTALEQSAHISSHNDSPKHSGGGSALNRGQHSNHDAHDTSIRKPVDEIVELFREIARISAETTQTQTSSDEQKVREQVLKDLYAALEHTSPSALPDITTAIARIKQQRERNRSELRAQKTEMKCLWEDVFTVFLGCVTTVLNHHLHSEEGGRDITVGPGISQSGQTPGSQVEDDEHDRGKRRPLGDLDYGTPGADLDKYDLEYSKYRRSPELMASSKRQRTEDTEEAQRSTAWDKSPSAIMRIVHELSKRIDEQDRKINDLMGEIANMQMQLPLGASITDRQILPSVRQFLTPAVYGGDEFSSERFGTDEIALRRGGVYDPRIARSET